MYQRENVPYQTIQGGQETLEERRRGPFPPFKGERDYSRGPGEVNLTAEIACKDERPSKGALWSGTTVGAPTPGENLEVQTGAVSSVTAGFKEGQAMIEEVLERET